MTRPQISIRLVPSLMEKLNTYVEITGTSKTDVVVTAIAQYLGCDSAVPLSQRMAEVEMRLGQLEAEVRGKPRANAN